MGSIRLLVAGGADPDISDMFGESPLDRAVVKKNVPIVQLLFDRLVRMRMADSCPVGKDIVKHFRGIFQIFIKKE